LIQNSHPPFNDWTDSFKRETFCVNAYLKESEVIDWKHPSIRSLAADLSTDCRSTQEIAKKCFEWVRDNVRHSWDYKLNPVTWRASDVLRHRTGFCYAKSHLLGGLLRANSIPVGFCYQRLDLKGDGSFCLHGLNAVFLPNHGWYRIDPRGNKEDIDAQFYPPIERLAFSANDNKLVTELPEIWPEPLSCVVSLLRRCSDYLDVYNNLPDIELVSTITTRSIGAEL
jgi:transglutaminase-like putative cysteine protease